METLQGFFSLFSINAVLSIILAGTVPFVLWVGYQNRKAKDLGIGWQFIRYLVIGFALPIVAILALNDALSSEAATIFAGALGYAFGNSGSAEKKD